MTLVRIVLIGIFLFCVAAVFGALSVILTLILMPMDEYDRELSDREQMEYLEEWQHEND